MLPLSRMFALTEAVGEGLILIGNGLNEAG